MGCGACMRGGRLPPGPAPARPARRPRRGGAACPACPARAARGRGAARAAAPEPRGHSSGRAARAGGFGPARRERGGRSDAATPPPPSLLRSPCRRRGRGLLSPGGLRAERWPILPRRADPGPESSRPGGGARRGGGRGPAARCPRPRRPAEAGAAHPGWGEGGPAAAAVPRTRGRGGGGTWSLSPEWGGDEGCAEGARPELCRGGGEGWCPRPLLQLQVQPAAHRGCWLGAALLNEEPSRRSPEDGAWRVGRHWWYQCEDLLTIKYMTMGDMKTPDFDDLLAAFDIPDMVDPKAAIESGHDDHESHIKQNAHTDEDSHAPSSSDVGVSVIVKNVRTIDSSEGVDKDGHHSTGNGLHNGFLTSSALDSYSKDEGKSLKDDGSASETTLKDSAFNQFSPISSAEEFDDDEKIEVDDPLDKEEMRANFRANVLAGSGSQQEYDKLKALGGEHLIKSGIPVSSSIDKNKVAKRETEATSMSLSVYEPFKARKTEDKLLKDNSEKLLENRVLDGKLNAEKSETNLASISQSKAKSSAKLSSCIAAIAALSAKKAATDTGKDLQSNSGESSPLPKDMSESPRAIEKSPESQSLIDGAKKPSVKPPDSPRSVSSENSSKGSPSSPAGSTPAIPKVRIKTIKTSSGEIKRTVTRVLPEVDVDSGKKLEQTASMVTSMTSLLSSPASAPVLSSPPRAPLQSTAVTTAVASAELAPKQVTIKPVATAFLPVSAVKTAGSQVINLKLANNTTVKATVISAASVQSASSAIIKAANAIQQQTVVVPASSLASAKLVPKTVHLANLNLLPQGAQTTSELRQVLTKPQQQIKQAIISAAASQPSKKVSRVQVVSSLQSSVVEAFNKVLSSVNPVPVYIPNLSPPANAGITLPTRGYKCLECGDSFALEKSLTQHYDRRSVRIEVTCNHCTKNLVFYNKCSLLSHARGHKEKGVVMQCSHLILKPVPADQMIASPSSNSALSVLQSPGGAGAHAVTKIQSGITGTVISAPASTPVIPAMPLDEDPSKLCRHSLKCLECNEVFQDETSLATHFQQAADTSGQSMHGTLKSVEGPPNLGINLPLSTKPTTQNSASHNKEDTKAVNGTEKLEKKSASPMRKAEPKKVANPGWTCWECDRLFTQRDVYISHMRKEHGKQMKKHPCRQCDKSFSSSHSLCRHNRIKHKGIRKVYTCSHCPDSRRTFTKRLMLEKHIQLMHGIKDPDVKEMTESTNMEEREVKEDAKVPSPKRKLEEPVLEFRPPRGAITQPLKKLKINVFKVHKCAVCGFTTENLLQFHEHIPQHKSDGSSYQCRECGLCYTSHVSLSRHLFIVHKLKEPQPVSKQNGSGEDNQQENKPSQEDESSDSAASDRRCKVCAKTFETEAALNTHMRTHGMAFIKSKRMSSAEK
ncbi:zinc finger protein 532 isoform X3 [Patagioenas fasciata]|uniref:zinc finger protein 532 isoform X3 n=2 Tax=Patagioenas fasciata TaxID=372321 RepID=UPI0032E894F6